MKSTRTRQAAATLRATLVIVAFTALAAVGLATTQSLRPLQSPVAPTTSRASISTTGTSRLAPVHQAPAACPMPAGVFKAR